MEYSLSILIGAIIGLIIISGFFSGSETSLTSASKPRMHELAKSGDKKARLFTKIFKDKEILIATILFANILVKETGTGTTSDFDGNFEIIEYSDFSKIHPPEIKEGVTKDKKNKVA